MLHDLRAKALTDAQREGKYLRCSVGTRTAR
ncbi:hypothetical protein PIGHUM_02791 [Pigmentiphaga humi]|uniref:Uncharacterized protein n=1 Tax=Pigmentiphaga humi TaxID=2478468 RepID=A0A3P4B6B3_9BURK|nr:hypothetical protein PIGHUM_02791 [Pigmentiphaga humi]